MEEIWRSPKSSRFVSERVRKTPPSEIRKFFDLLSSTEGVISLGIGEPDFVTPWHITEAGVYAVEKGYTMYTSNYGLAELREELAHYLWNQHRAGYDPKSEILITVGVSEAFDLAIRATINPGDEVIIPEPSFVSYPPCVILAGGIPVFVPTRVEKEFKLEAKEVEKRITERTKAIVLSYPNNPTGAVMNRAELLEIAELAQRHNLIVLSDEIYSRLVYGVEHICFPTLPGMKERTILLGGFSKTYAMTGWRIGFAAAPAELIEAMVTIHQYTIMCAPIMSQKAAVEALRNGERAVNEMLEEYDRRRRIIVKGLNEIGLTCFEPKGAFYAFPSVKDLGFSSGEFAERLLLEEKVAVIPGPAFGPSGEGHVRCCYAVSIPEIEEALERMERFVRKYR